MIIALTFRLTFWDLTSPHPLRAARQSMLDIMVVTPLCASPGERAKAFYIGKIFFLECLRISDCQDRQHMPAGFAYSALAVVLQEYRLLCRTFLKFLAQK